MSLNTPPRNFNVLLLSFSQAISLSGASIVVLLGGLIGREIAPTPALATLPISLMIVGAAISSVPAAMLMQRIGRRGGFMTAAALAALAAILAAYAVAIGSFALFCLATLQLGASNAFVQQYRFAAAESVSPDRVSQAVSYVLLGGIVAGVIGPELGKRASDWLPYGEYTGSFAVLALLYVTVLLLMAFYQGTIRQAQTVSGEARPLKKIISQPEFIVAALTAAVGYGVMSFIMTATPVNMQTVHGFVLGQTTIVIQSHVLGMYVPSLFTGWLIARLGVKRMILAGVVVMLACMLLALAGVSFAHYWGALVLLGVGWNFMFVGGTTLLTSTYRPAERFKAQAVNDFSVFGVQAFASLSAGTMIYLSNWNTLILATLPFLFLVLTAILWMHRFQVRRAAGALA